MHWRLIKIMGNPRESHTAMPADLFIKSKINQSLEAMYSTISPYLESISSSQKKQVTEAGNKFFSLVYDAELRRTEESDNLKTLSETLKEERIKLRNSAQTIEGNPHKSIFSSEQTQFDLLRVQIADNSKSLYTARATLNSLNEVISQSLRTSATAREAIAAGELDKAYHTLTSGANNLQQKLDEIKRRQERLNSEPESEQGELRPPSYQALVAAGDFLSGRVGSNRDADPFSKGLSHLSSLVLSATGETMRKSGWGESPGAMDYTFVALELAGLKLTFECSPWGLPMISIFAVSQSSDK